MPATRRAAGSTGNVPEEREPHPWRPDVEGLGLTDIVQLQNLLSEVLRKRFTRHLALCFTDVVGSTPYVSRFGDEAGRRLQQRHFDALETAIAPHEGRIVDTAGDGAFCCFFTVDAAATALFDFFRLLGEDNDTRSAQEALSVRCGLHWGEVLTDGSVVSGEAVHLCSRVGQGSQGGKPGNDVVLALRDAEATQAISRYHFELRGDAGGFKLRAIAVDESLVTRMP